MRVHKIIYLLWTIIIFSIPVEIHSERLRALTEETKNKRLVTREEDKPVRLKKQQMVEKITVPEDDDEKKTLAQQVLDGKYGLIQTELFSEPVKRPGILSYEVNPEVPKDNINNLGGLKPEEIWLAENHLLVLKGGGFSEKEQVDKVAWPPIDNYIAPQRQVKIPPNPKVPPPFPIQLQEGGPIEIIKGKNSTKAVPPFFNGGPFGPPFLFPIPPNVPTGNKEDDSNQSQGNFTKGNGGAPFPYLPPGVGLYPPAIAFLPPPGNLTELDEDDPRIYYPPKYDFVYKKNYTSHVPPGPLVPGIILPPPPNFFAPLNNSSRVHRPGESNKLTNSAKKSRLTLLNGSRQKSPSHPRNYKPKVVHAHQQPKVVSPIHVINMNENYEQPSTMKPNLPNEEWVPIPAPRPFYITEINKLKALTNHKANDHSHKYEGPKNGWDYANSTTTEMHSLKDNEYTRNDYKNGARENDKNEQSYTTERNKSHLKAIEIPRFQTTESYDNNLKSTLLPEFHPTYETTIKPNIPTQYYTTEKYENKLTPSVPLQDNISNYELSSLLDEEKHSVNSNNPVIRGKVLTHDRPDPPTRIIEKYVYQKPYVEINTLLPQRVYGDVTIKTPSAGGRLVLPNIKYVDDYKNTVKPPSKPLSFLYYEQESKYQADDGGYSYDVPLDPVLDPYRSQQYRVEPVADQEKVNTYSSTTKKPPVYEYSYSAPGYGTLEAPKVGNSISTTARPVIYETNFKPIKQPQFSYFQYQSPVNQNDYNKVKPTSSPPVYSAPQSPVSTKPKYVKVDSYQTENPYVNYHTQDLGLLDDITKKYFTLFGQKINPDGTREITTSLPPTNQNYYEKPYYKNYGQISAIPTKAPNTNVRFPEVYNIQSDNPYYQNEQEYTTPKYRPNKKPKTNVDQSDNYSYYYSPSNSGYNPYKGYNQEVVRPNHPLHSDIHVNYNIQNPTIEPDSEFIDPAYLNPNQGRFNGNSYISYRLPGNSGHFYFLTPQSVQQQNYALRNSRSRYEEIEKRGYIPRNIRQSSQVK